MAEALFSSFLMVDQPIAPVAGGRLPAGAKRQESSASPALSDRDLIAEAILRALKEMAPADAASAGIVHLAAATADIALGQSVVLRLNPDLDVSHRSAVRSFLEMVVRVSATLDETRLESAIGKLAEVLLPDELADARGALASDNLELRNRFVAEIPQLTSADIGRQAGLTTKNPYATAARWKKSGDIFSVQHGGKEYFPAFQFREGRPHPTIKQVLLALPRRLSAWQRAFWFVSTNGWLSDKAPIDVLEDPEAIVAAAKQEGEEVIG